MRRLPRQWARQRRLYRPTAADHATSPISWTRQRQQDVT
jgi:hypothetical protein